MNLLETSKYTLWQTITFFEAKLSAELLTCHCDKIFRFRYQNYPLIHGVASTRTIFARFDNRIDSYWLNSLEKTSWGWKSRRRNPHTRSTTLNVALRSPSPYWRLFKGHSLTSCVLVSCLHLSKLFKLVLQLKAENESWRWNLRESWKLKMKVEKWKLSNESWEMWEVKMKVEKWRWKLRSESWKLKVESRVFAIRGFFQKRLLNSAF
jgi:hypothetical protein